MSLQLEGKIVVVTGAARGIGRAIAEACVREGAIVELVDRLGDELAATAREMSQAGGDVRPNVCDLANPSAVQRLFAGIAARRNRIDGLVNNAGTTVYGGALDTTLEDVHRTIDLHVAPTLLCAQYAARLMLAAGNGAIVNMASAAAVVAVTRFFAYAMAKAAVISMTQQMATEWGSRGVTVNALAPGPVLTDALRRNQNQQMQSTLLADIPAARFAEPAEIAGAAVFLLSAAGRYVNGHVLLVDGGMATAGTRLDRLAA